MRLHRRLASSQLTAAQCRQQAAPAAACSAASKHSSPSVQLPCKSIESFWKMRESTRSSREAQQGAGVVGPAAASGGACIGHLFQLFSWQSVGAKTAPTPCSALSTLHCTLH